ncbi:hypothetical protein [Neolewinella persica]|uniref:hypothetical protein n=1 Tax=Neolewinella persica TaxID=70998 RepID=UPI00037FE4D3|nr:hypothetical protein [Neolewinella persica]
MSRDDLIDDAFEEIRPLNFKSGSSGLLSVNWKAWLEKLVVVERRSQVGCFVLLVFFFVGLYVRSISHVFATLLLPCFFLGIVYVMIQARRHKNLRDHGRYRYELFPNKVVRFSDRDFKAFEFKELSKVTVKPYGVLLVRKRQLRNNWLSYRSPEIMVLPASIISYPAVEKYVVEQFEKTKKGE